MLLIREVLSSEVNSTQLQGLRNLLHLQHRVLRRACAIAGAAEEFRSSVCPHPVDISGILSALSCPLSLVRALGLSLALVAELSTRWHTIQRCDPKRWPCPGPPTPTVV
jgi:hypothetical protein